MKLSQLKALVKKGESEILEFKASTGSIDGAWLGLAVGLELRFGTYLIRIATNRDKSRQIATFCGS
jgi:hypothetical protein